MLNRPSTLPAKDCDEERRHRDEYEAILQAVKKRDIENTKQRKKKQEKQLKQEDQLSAAAKQWANHILPSWDSLLVPYIYTYPLKIRPYIDECSLK